MDESIISGRIDTIPGVGYVATEFGHIVFFPLGARRSMLVLKAPGLGNLFETRATWTVLPIPGGVSRSAWIARLRAIAFLYVVFQLLWFLVASFDPEPASPTGFIVAVGLFVLTLIPAWYPRASFERAVEILKLADADDLLAKRVEAIYGRPITDTWPGRKLAEPMHFEVQTGSSRPPPPEDTSWADLLARPEMQEEALDAQARTAMRASGPTGAEANAYAPPLTDETRPGLLRFAASLPAATLGHMLRIALVGPRGLPMISGEPERLATTLVSALSLVLGPPLAVAGVLLHPSLRRIVGARLSVLPFAFGVRMIVRGVGGLVIAHIPALAPRTPRAGQIAGGVLDALWLVLLLAFWFATGW